MLVHVLTCACTGRSRKSYLTLRDGILNLLDLDLTKPFDFQEIAASGSMDRSNCVVTIRLQLCDVNRSDAVRLNGVNIDNEATLC